jgi:hypothetical protein
MVYEPLRPPRNLCDHRVKAFTFDPPLPVHVDGMREAGE